jgi:hypothetical protein
MVLIELDSIVSGRAGALFIKVMNCPSPKKNSLDQRMAYKFLTEPFDLDVMKQEEVRQVFSVK